MGDGSRKVLEDVQIGDFVISHTGKPCRVEAVHVQGLLPVLDITTESGRKITVAYDHPLLTPTGWVQAQHLEVDNVLAQVVPECEGAGSEPLEAFRLAGYFVGDGNTSAASNPSTSQASITCFDDVQADDIRTCAASLGFTAKDAKDRSRRKMAFSAGSASIQEWLRETGLARKTSWTKRVPEFVYKGTKKQIAHFVGAYFACDGTLHRKSAKHKHLAITFYSVNKPLLEDVQHLLLRLGVRSRIREHVANNNTFKGGRYVSYRLSITSYDDTSRFVERVFIVGEKAERLAEWGIRRNTFDSVLIADPIVAIEKAGEKECRCLTVADDHSFTVSDLAVHNSLLVCVLWPAWAWTHVPEMKWLFSSYSQTLTTRDSVRCRRLIRSPWYQERWGDVYALADDQDTKTRYENNRSGYRYSTSFASGTTGDGGNIRVVDDPHAASDVNSDAVLGSQIQWFKETWSTRYVDANTDRDVIIMQRLHERDLSGFVLGEKLGYEHLMLPAEFDPERRCVTSLPWADPRTEEGELLDAKRLGPEPLAKLKKTLGPQGAAGQLAQNPSPAEGGMMKRWYWRFWCPTGTAETLGPVPLKGKDGQLIHVPPNELPESFDMVAQGWDMAFKKTTSSDPVAGHVWAAKGSNRYLLGRRAGRMDIVESIEGVRTLSAEFPEAYAKYVESAANGPAVVDLLKDELEGLILVTPQEIGGSKTARVVAVVPALAAGNVHLPHPALAPWVWEVIDQCAKFPNAVHDDDVDALTLTLIKMRELVSELPEPRNWN